MRLFRKRRAGAVSVTFPCAGCCNCCPGTAFAQNPPALLHATYGPNSFLQGNVPNPIPLTRGPVGAFIGNAPIWGFPFPFPPGGLPSVFVACFESLLPIFGIAGGRFDFAMFIQCAALGLVGLNVTNRISITAAICNPLNATFANWLRANRGLECGAPFDFVGPITLTL